MLFIEFPTNGNRRGNNRRVRQRVNQGHRGQQILRCRELKGDDGNPVAYLEADYASKCYDDAWWAYFTGAFAFAVVYCLGVPYYFWWVVRNAKREGKLDNPAVKKAIGWMPVG